MLVPARYTRSASTVLEARPEAPAEARRDAASPMRALTRATVPSMAQVVGTPLTLEPSHQVLRLLPFSSATVRNRTSSQAPSYSISEDSRLRRLGTVSPSVQGCSPTTRGSLSRAGPPGRLPLK